ncbi:unnamed protein product [Closterium sp. Naga37s-1]|nr:unnamed protein product [Closterium sp. Naga37s-1]
MLLAAIPAFSPFRGVLPLLLLALLIASPPSLCAAERVTRLVLLPSNAYSAKCLDGSPISPRSSPPSPSHPSPPSSRAPTLRRPVPPRTTSARGRARGGASGTCISPRAAGASPRKTASIAPNLASVPRASGPDGSPRSLETAETSTPRLPAVVKNGGDINTVSGAPPLPVSLPPGPCETCRLSTLSSSPQSFETAQPTPCSTPTHSLVPSLTPTLPLLSPLPHRPSLPHHQASEEYQQQGGLLSQDSAANPFFSQQIASNPSYSHSPPPSPGIGGIPTGILGIPTAGRAAIAGQDNQPRVPRVEPDLRTRRGMGAASQDALAQAAMLVPMPSSCTATASHLSPPYDRLPPISTLLSHHHFFRPAHEEGNGGGVSSLRTRRGMGAASHVLFSGSSAGGHAIIMHCDRLAAAFPRAKATCLSDSGFFVDAKDRFGQNFWRGRIQALTALHRINVPKCPAAGSQVKDNWVCFLPENSLPQITTPLFLFQFHFDPRVIFHENQLPRLPRNSDHNPPMSVIALALLASSRPTCSRFPPLPALLLPLLALLLAALPRSLCAAGRVNRLKSATATRLVLLRNNAYGAKCLDGSPPAYYFRAGAGAGRRKWHVNFPRGGWCFSPAECLERANSSFGSSRFWATRLPAIIENGGMINSVSDS